MIPIYEAGERDGQLYLAMRYVDGSDLKTILERDGKLAPERTLAILAQVAGRARRGPPARRSCTAT